MIARILAAASVLLLSTPGMAAPDMPWEGVYEGKVGRYPVTACFQSWGHGSNTGVYYYHSQLRPIRLTGSDDPAIWIESREGERWDDQSGPRWSLTAMDGTNMRGMWRDGARRLPIAMTRAKGSVAEGDLPCSSASFLARRSVPVTFDRAEAEIDGFAFTRLFYLPPRHFDDVAIEGFTYTPVHGGDGDIVRELEALLPRGTVDDDFLQCIGGALGSLGADGFWEQTVTPAYVDQAFMAVTVSLGSFCGGAHPNFGSNQKVFDRESGREVDLATWLGESALADVEFEWRPLAPALRELAIHHWPAGSEGECREAASEQPYWQFGISAQGFTLTPDFPHALTACEETATVPWAEIEPFLSDEGKRSRARMRR
ncbi:MAG: hypothetical protein KJZ64_15210 [Sphingomonadaceae bacterium]|nr:hypothetical protein [Sphingomonadaceae bacterium]